MQRATDTFACRQRDGYPSLRSGLDRVGEDRELLIRECPDGLPGGDRSRERDVRVEVERPRCGEVAVGVARAGGKLDDARSGRSREDDEARLRAYRVEGLLEAGGAHVEG